MFELIYKDWSKLRGLHGVCTTWLRLFLHEANKNCDESLNVFREIRYEFAGPSCFVRVLTISKWYWTIVYGSFQCVIGFLVYNCVSMDTNNKKNNPFQLKSDYKMHTFFCIQYRNILFFVTSVSNDGHCWRIQKAHSHLMKIVLT